MIGRNQWNDFKNGLKVILLEYSKKLDYRDGI
jgi:hypothetical protein